jgi:hypothetical protein
MWLPLIFYLQKEGGSGLELHLDQVPTREPGISPYEMMLSETQERMFSYLSTKRSVFVTSPITALSSSCFSNKSKNFCSVPFSTTNNIT